MNIRNFVIISHIDHGKSTLADRLLEITGTIESSKIGDRYLDRLESERERGITIKMAPVRMNYCYKDTNYLLNLIDTPGHPDFSYEVSRALKAVEGAILLIDLKKGIQAQTLANLNLAKTANLVIIPVINKIDLLKSGLNIDIDDLAKKIAELTQIAKEKILKISAKTGQGVKELLTEIIKKIPPPASKEEKNLSQALVFDSFYDEHKGIVAAVRVFAGEFKTGDKVKFLATNQELKIKEVGYFSPELTSQKKITKGEIGYIATGIKDPEKVKIGDTVSKINNLSFPLEGFKEPNPSVFVSFYPENVDFFDLKSAFLKLKLNDSALKIEPDFNEVLGKGLKVGFLGKLHFEITTERLEKEFNIKTITTFPSVVYKVKVNKKFLTIFNPSNIPDYFDEIYEPMVKVDIISPVQFLGSIFQLKELFRITDIETKNITEKTILISLKMPLQELIIDFDDKLKSITQGYASFSYQFLSFEKSDLKKIEILVVHQPIQGLVKIVHQDKVIYEARKMVEKLKKILPKQQFPQPIQARVDGRIIARETVPALKKDVTGHLYGGDRTRKDKLLKKQKEGKKKLLSLAKAKIPSDVFKKMIKE